MTPPQDTLPQMIFEQASRHGARAAMKVKRAGPVGRQAGAYQDISWEELADQVRKVALGLIDLGVRPGDRAAILSENRPEWAIADLAILAAGGATVPVYTTLASEEIGHILADSGARILFVSNPDLMSKVLPLQLAMDLKVILFDAPYRVAGPRVWWFGEVLGLGETSGPKTREALEERISMAQGDDLASILYTSGTTGPPKGVMLTHRNFLSNCAAIGQALPVGETDLHLSFLPLSHVFERCGGYYFVLSAGATIAYAESMETVAANLLEVRPTILTAVPRFYEKLHERIQESVRGGSPLKRRIFAWAVRVGRRNRIADRIVFSKLRARMGGRIRFCVSGGAPLSRELAEFFHKAGILILEGYGLTETSPVITVNRPERFRFGSVGLPLPGVEVRIAGDGEILTRGPHVMRGYFNNPAATAEVLDPEGWFHTGDIGRIDAEGFLVITDRKKDLIKTSGGKMVAPQNLENVLKAGPWIADCVVIGDRRKYVTALIVPRLERLEAFAREQGLGHDSPESLLALAPVRRLIQEQVDRLNRTLAPFEQIKRFALLLEPFTLQSGELTPTLKVKRRVIAERFAAQIESLYQE